MDSQSSCSGTHAVRFIFQQDISVTSYSFFLSPTSFWLTRLGVEGYYAFDHTHWHTTIGRTPLDEGSARRRETSAWQHTTLTTNIHALCGILLLLLLLLSVFHLYYYVFLIVLAVPFHPYCATHNTNIHAPGGIRTRNPSRRAAADPRLRPLGHWDRRLQ